MIKCQDIECKFEGLQNGYVFDKSFIVVNDGEIIGDNTFPNLIQISPKLEKNFMILSASGMIDLKIDVERLHHVKATRQILWNGIVETVDAGEEAAKWLSRFVVQEDFSLRLIYLPTNPTTTDENFILSKFMNFLQRNKTLSGSESFSLICENSVNDLCAKKEKKLLPNELEPNFIVRGPSAFDENSWKWVKIGEEAHFRNLNQQNKIDPTDEKKDKEEEVPEYIRILKSITKYCKKDTKPMKGISLRLKNPGKVKIGDPIYVEE